MGRRDRKRKRKMLKPKDFDSIDHKEDVILLKSWLHSEGFKVHDKLCIAHFHTTGRGVAVKQRINPGDLLIDIPLSLILCWPRIALDENFKSLFSRNNIDVKVQYKKSLSFQDLLSFYLMYLKYSHDDKWKFYIESLPLSYDLPFYLTFEQKQYLEESIKKIVSKQEEVISKAFDIFQNILHNSSSEINIDLLKKNFSLENYSWSYFTVNTRCVYLSLEDVLNCNELSEGVADLLFDKPTLALCPYLDLINHSVTAQNETKLILQKDVKHLNSESLKNVRFHLYTKSLFSPYSQLFICYGDSHNLKLICEYGFYIPQNELDYLPLDFNDLCTFLASINKGLTATQMKILLQNNFVNNLYLEKEGLSFNLFAILFVSNFIFELDQNVLYNIVQFADKESIKSKLKVILRPLLETKLNELLKKILNLKNYPLNLVVRNCLSLMETYVDILKSNLST